MSFVNDVLADAGDRKSLDLYEDQFNSSNSKSSKQTRKTSGIVTKRNALILFIAAVITFWFFEQILSTNTSSSVYESTINAGVDPRAIAQQGEVSLDFQVSYAKKLHQVGQFSAAQELLHKVLLADKDHLQARLLLASTLTEQDQKRDAIKLYTEGFRYAPREPHIAQPLAKLLEGEGKIDLAIKVLQHAAPSKVSDPEYYAEIATLQQKLGRHTSVIEIYRQILTVRPEKREWWLSLGISLLAETKEVEARKAFEMSLQDKSLSPALQLFVHQRIKEMKRS